MPSRCCRSLRQCRLPAGDTAEGFDNIATALQVSPSFIEQYVIAARAVEAFGSVVCRQEFVRINVGCEEIANRVCVFLAVEPVQYDLIRNVRLAFRVVDRALEPCDQRINRRCVRLLRAGRRHHASTELSHGLFEQFSMLADARRSNSLKAEAAGL